MRQLIQSRKFQIVIAAILILVIAVFWRNRDFKRRQEEVVDRLRASGADVKWSSYFDDAKYPWANDPDRYHPWVESLTKLFGGSAPIRGLTTLGNITADDADLLERLSDLSILALINTTVDRTLVRNIASCPRLRVLALIDCNVTDDGVASLATLMHLHTLELLWRELNPCVI
jgi:hypothetical protein